MPEFLAQLVTCGVGAGKPCTICDIWVLSDNVVDFLLQSLAAPILVIVLVVGGFIYVTSGGNPKRTEQAKSLLTSAIVGIIIALAAWLIVNTILNVLVKKEFVPPWTDIKGSDCPLPLEPTPVDLSKLPRSDLIAPPGTYQTEAEARQALNRFPGININKEPCSFWGETNCTDVKGLPKSTGDKLWQLQTKCTSGNIPCRFVLTGGTEGEGIIHKTHGIGESAVDIAPEKSNPTTQDYKNLKSVALSEGASVARCEAQGGAHILTCDGKTNHIHVEFPR